MASSQNSAILSGQLKVVSKAHPAATSSGAAVTTGDAYVGGWQDMRDYGALLVQYHKVTGAGTLAKFKLFAASSSTGANATEVKAHALGSNPDAINDTIVLECTAQEIGAMGDSAGTNLRYVAAQVAHDTAADRASLAYIFGNPRFSQGGLTADVVA